MSIKFRFVWVDDRIERAQDFIGGLNGSLRKNPVETDLEVVAVTTTVFDDLSQKASEWILDPPDLIMLDHDFSKVGKRMFALSGSALAHLLRIQLPRTPIVCMSGQKINSDQFNIEDLSEYTYIFDVNEINGEENLERLFSIANDFNLLCFPEKKAVRQALVDVLLPPESDKPSLLSVLPEEFEGTFVHGTSPHRMARWVLNILMRRPGFLCDSLEVATFLGLNEAAFTNKVQQYFGSARYKGPFATDTKPLWWASALTDVLYEVLPQQMALSPSGAGRQFSGIVEEDFSRCGVTNEHTPAPDVVAYTDSTKTERRAVKSSYTIPLSDEASSILGFSTRLRIRNERRGASIG